MAIIAAPGMPELQDFRFGWGGNRGISVDWLVSEVLFHLRATRTNMCILEDVCGSSSEPDLAAGAAGPAWFHQDRVFWPITQNMATIELIKKAFDWGLVGRPALIAFCSEPRSTQDLAHTLEVPETLLEELANSTVRLVTDIFDEEGYLEWGTKQGCS
jgi:hypothetical protein